MKKLIIIVLSALFMLTACTGGESGNGTVGAGIVGTETAGNGNAVTPLTNDHALQGTLTVSAFDSMMAGNFLNEAARLFMEQHPGTEINIETFSSPPEIRMAEGAQGSGMVTMVGGGMNPQERRDYINMINTELMSGGGPDILALDVLPFYQYARNGLLVDLLDLMEADPAFDINDYRRNIFDALTTPDGLFMFPLDYTFEYITFDSDLFDDTTIAELSVRDVFTHDELIQLGMLAFEMAQNTSDTPVPMFPMHVSPGLGRGLLSSIFALNHNHFVDIPNRQANFTNGDFEALLTSVLQIENDGLLMPRQDMQDMQRGVMRVMNQGSVYSFRNSTQLLHEFHTDESVQGFVMAGGSGAASGLFGSDSEMIAGLLASDAGEVPFTLGHAFGINSNSNNQALAWEFIKFLSTDATRDSFLMRGLPTHIETFEARTTQAITDGMMSIGSSAMGGMITQIVGGSALAGAFEVEESDTVETATERDANQEMTPEQIASFNEYVAAVEHFTGLLNTFHTTNTLIDDVISNALTEFFDGTSTASEVAQNLQSRISLVLNE